MDHFPIFVALAGRRVVLSGGGEAALAKLRLLLKTTAHITVFSPNASPKIKAWHNAGKLRYIPRRIEPGDAMCAVLAYAADEDSALDTRTSQIARADGAMVNIVDNLGDSQFITPAIVDRDPVTIAIGTEGAAPVLARAIKADLEERLPQSLGTLARIGKTFRKAADSLPMGRARRDFWRDYYFNAGPAAISEDDIQDALNITLAKHVTQKFRDAHVAFVGAGPGDPELLTLKARKAIDEADVIIHDRLVTPEILELARREALIVDAGKEGFGPSMSQNSINDLIAEHTQNGAQVVRLKSGDPTIFGRLDEEIETCLAHDLSYTIIPGITAASAAVAAIGQSFTRRCRNGTVRFLTGHDMKGFADHDWAALAKPDAVAAIYMGKKAARFVQGRLLMHGADRLTPVTLIENASRADQRIIPATLETLAEVTAVSGPAVIFLGLAPRDALTSLATLPQEEFA
ncbi:siroheme synthase CysG [Planktotalea sp.]|uniref:siroheme synthase CysG n=1 Tax=Planktotalea sp. TaxID=2029877 RepID=UPI0025F45B54|nr:siroheme synthase CysG [Planktotalea sp.]